MSLLDWPVISLDEVFHIGTFERADKGRTHNTTSLEGNGLSVSLEPEAWRAIARLGDSPTWSLRATDPCALVSFVDFHALKAPHWEAVMAWAESNGLVQPTEILEVSWLDGESGARRAFTFDASEPNQAASAQEEFDALVGENYADADEAAADPCGPRLARQPAWRALPTLNERIGFDVAIGLVRDLSLTLFVEDVLYPAIGLQGVWWMDSLDIGACSAPRGVIHATALPSWRRELLDSPVDGRRRREGSRA